MTFFWELTTATLANIDLDDNPYSRHQIASNDWVLLIINYLMVIKDWTDSTVARIVKETDNR